MASVQNLESRIGVIERKLDFIMKLASVTKRTPSTLMPGEYIDERISMKDLYNEISTSDSELAEVSNG